MNCKHDIPQESCAECNPVAQAESVGVRMAEFVNARIPTTDWRAAEVSAKICAELEEQAPEMLHEWLWENREQAIALLITARQRQSRRTKRQQFSDAAGAFENGDKDALGTFGGTHPIDDKNTHRRVADMTGRDHEYVASKYSRDGKSALLLAEFHRAVAAKVGERRTADVLSETEYVSIQASILGKAA